MSKVTWPNATVCFNCGTEEGVYRDIGLCSKCETTLLARKHEILDEYRALLNPHWEAIRELEGQQAAAIDHLFRAFKIPPEFIR